MTKRNIKVHQPIYQVINWLHLFTKIKKMQTMKTYHIQKIYIKMPKKQLNSYQDCGRRTFLKNNWKFIDWIINRGAIRSIDLLNYIQKFTAFKSNVNLTGVENGVWLPRLNLAKNTNRRINFSCHSVLADF